MFTSIEIIIQIIISLLLYIPNYLYQQLIKNNIYNINTHDDLNYVYDLSNKLVIITGANTGIGKETAKALAILGAEVILACRDDIKGESAQNEINNYIKQLNIKTNGIVKYINLDLISFKSIHKFTKIFQSLFNNRNIDIIVNNAGINIDGVIHFKDITLQQIFIANYLGHYLLFHLLKDNITKSRIVNVSSVMHHLGRPNYKVYSSYNDTKLYNNLFTYEINKRYNYNNVIAISVNPGAVRSDIWRHIPQPFLYIYDYFMKLLYLNVQQGCKTSVSASIVSDSSLCEYRQANSNVSRQTNLSFCSNIPYLIPYYIPISYLTLGFEAIGPFYKANYGKVSLPINHDTISYELWNLSNELCLKILFNEIELEEFNQIKRLFKYNQ